MDVLFSPLYSFCWPRKVTLKSKIQLCKVWSRCFLRLSLVYVLSLPAAKCRIRVLYIQMFSSVLKRWLSPNIIYKPKFHGQILVQQCLLFTVLPGPKNPQNKIKLRKSTTQPKFPVIEDISFQKQLKSNKLKLLKDQVLIPANSLRFEFTAISVFLSFHNLDSVPP